MKLEDIVCDFEYAEKLSELGVDRKSLLAYSELDEGELTSYVCDCDTKTYTVAELGEMFPNRICNKAFTTVKACNKYGVGYSDFNWDILGGMYCDIDEPKEANARAKLLIWLIEYNHVNVNELNGETK